MHLSVGSQLGSGVCITLPQAQNHDSEQMKFLLEMRAREWMQEHSQRTWISISFMMFGSCITKGGLIQGRSSPVKGHRSGMWGTHKGFYQTIWSGLRWSFQPLFDHFEVRYHVHPSCPVVIPLSPNKKYWCICAMCSSSPKTLIALSCPWRKPAHITHQSASSSGKWIFKQSSPVGWAT